MAAPYDTISALGGRCTHVAGRGNLLVVGDKGGLNIIDVTDPKAASLVGYLPLHGTVNGIAVEPPLAYVAAGSAGVIVVDLSTPAQPSIAGTYVTTKPAHAVYVKNHKIFVAAEQPTLLVLDVSNPATPQFLGEYSDLGAGDATAIDCSGNVAAISATNRTVFVNITEPASPQFLSRISNVGYSMSYQDGTVVVGSSDSLIAFSLADPHNPVLLGPYNIDTSVVNGTITSLAIFQGVAYVSFSNQGLAGVDLRFFDTAYENRYFGPFEINYGDRLSFNQVSIDPERSIAYCITDSQAYMYDLTLPGGPKLLGSYDSPGSGNGAALVNGTGALADDTAGVEFLNIEDKTSPTLLGTYPSAVKARDVAIADHYAFITESGGFNSFEVVDILDPKMPVSAGSVQTSSLSRMEFTSPTAYLAGVNGLLVVDTTDPANSVLAKTIDVPGKAADIALDGNLCFVAYDNGGYNQFGVYIYDISSRLNPVFLKAVAEGIIVRVLAVSAKESLLAVLHQTNTQGANRLDLYDISNPSQPVLRGGLTMGSAADMELIGNKAVVVFPTLGELDVVDISDPQLPRKERTFSAGPLDYLVAPGRVSVQGNCALVGDGAGGLKLVDLSYLEGKAPTNTVQLLGPVAKTKVIGSTACLIDDAGLWTVDVAQASAPKLLAFEPIPGGVVDLDLFGDTAGVVTGTGNLHLFDVSDPANPISGTPYTLPETGTHIAMGSQMAAVSSSAHFQIVSVDGTNTPVLKSSRPLASIADLSVSGNLIELVTNPGDSLQVYDVSDPANPILAGSAPVHSGTYKLHTEGPRSLVVWQGVYQAALVVVDVSDPHNPHALGSFASNAYYADVGALRNVAIGTRPQKLEVVQIGDPSVPILDQDYPVDAITSQLDVNKNGIYLAAGEDGFLILEAPTLTSQEILDYLLGKSHNSDELDQNLDRTIDSADLIKLLKTPGL